MSRVRFVHAADLHLDSPFRGIQSVNPTLAHEFQQATFQAYTNIINLCTEQRVDALLVAGDVYDGADRSLQAQLRFYGGLSQLSDSGIRSFICHGNHDPLNGWIAQLKRPPLCHQFRETVEAVSLDPGAPDRGTIYGFSYPQRDVRDNVARGFLHDPRRGIGIGLLHANVGGNTDHGPYAPCTLSDLADSRINYWALGHIHKQQVLQAQGPTVVYSGNPQGRHPNETGARGVYLVELDDDGQATLQFLPMDVVRWEMIELDIGEYSQDQDLIDAMKDRLAVAQAGAEGRSLICRIRLTGRGTLHRALQQPNYLEGLREEFNQGAVQRRPFVWCERVLDATRPPFDREVRRQAGDFVATVLRSVDHLRGDPAATDALRGELAPLFSHPSLTKYFPDGLSDAELTELLERAEDRIVTALTDEA